MCSFIYVKVLTQWKHMKPHTITLAFHLWGRETNLGWPLSEAFLQIKTWLILLMTTLLSSLNITLRQSAKWWKHILDQSDIYLSGSMVWCILIWLKEQCSVTVNHSFSFFDFWRTCMFSTEPSWFPAFLWPILTKFQLVQRNLQ
jgi:hypothetical protein